MAKAKHTILKVALTACLAAALLALAACAKSESNATTDVQQTQDNMSSETSKTVNVSTDPFYVLLVGRDSREGTPYYKTGNAHNYGDRSDTIMLMRVDPVKYQVTLVTVPRDTKATLDSETVKINEAHNRYGIEGTISAVKELTGVSPDYYMEIKFTQFAEFINDMGGVNVDVPMTMTFDDILNHNAKLTLEEGNHTLAGNEALVFARQRKQYADDQDACRQIQDRQIVQRIVEATSAQPAGNAETFANILLSQVNTNMDKDVLVAYMQMFMANGKVNSFQSGTGPYKGDIDEASGLWVAIRDEGTWSQVIAEVNAGGDPTDIVPLPVVEKGE